MAFQVFGFKWTEKLKDIDKEELELIIGKDDKHA